MRNKKRGLLWQLDRAVTLRSLIIYLRLDYWDCIDMYRYGTAQRRRKNLKRLKRLLDGKNPWRDDEADKVNENDESYWLKWGRG
jgi:hypothetical protein